MRRLSKSRASAKKRPCIGIDLLGSDTPPESFAKAVLELTEEIPCDFIFFTTKEISKHFPNTEEHRQVIVSEVITMADDPLRALRKKKNASLCVGIKMLKDGMIDAFVSAGNTGALIGSAKLQLPMLPGISRPALLTLLPTKHDAIAVLDVGAAIHSKAKNLVQFAKMGIAYQKTRGISRPRVGLLNIGVEATKGTPELRETYEKLQELFPEKNSAALFAGNIEGKAVFEGDIDVLVTEGFSGNVFLKTAEGIAAFFLHQLKEELKASKNASLEWLEKLQKKLDYTEYPGAVLCGVEGIVVKSHGDSTPKALKNAIKGAFDLLQNQFLEKIKIELCTKK